MKRIFIFIVVFSVVLISCDTSLNVNADYKNIPVVYSLLDKNDTIQYVKLNKAFLGDASVSDMAQESDSLNYDKAIINLLKYKNGNLVKTFAFERTDTIAKDEGFFANDKNIIYIHKGDIINKRANGSDAEAPSDFNFVLDIDIPGLEKVSGETVTVSDVRVLAPLGSTYLKELILYTNQFLDPQYKFTAGKDAKYFEYFMEILYYEKQNGEYKLGMLINSEGTKTASSLDGTQTFPFTLYGESFYRYMEQELGPSNNERVFYALRYKFLSAGEDLSMYIDLTTPTYGIVQEKPAFTNVVNGWGIISSRTSTFSPYKKLNHSSLNYLSFGDITKELNFEDYTGTSNFYSNNRDLDIYDLYN